MSDVDDAKLLLATEANMQDGMTSSELKTDLDNALELLDLYFGPTDGIRERKEAFLVKHGWEKRVVTLTGDYGSGGTAIEWVKGERVCFLATALAEEVTEQFRGLKG